MTGGRSRRARANPGALMVALAASAVLLSAGRADAALFLVFSPDSGPSGILVRAVTGGEGALGSSTPVSVPIPIYLVPAAGADAVPATAGSADQLERTSAVTLIGSLRSDAAGNGSLTFRVPNLAPGRYVAVAFCTQCARYSAGRTVVPVGEFEVIPSRVPPAGAPWAALVVGLLVMLVVLAATADRPGRAGR